MIYQVNAKFFFVNPDEARDFYHDCATAIDKTAVVNPNQPTQELSHAELIECRHDNNPNEACEVAEEVDNRHLLDS